MIYDKILIWSEHLLIHTQNLDLLLRSARVHPLKMAVPGVKGSSVAVAALVVVLDERGRQVGSGGPPHGAHRLHHVATHRVRQARVEDKGVPGRQGHVAPSVLEATLNLALVVGRANGVAAKVVVRVVYVRQV